MIETAAVTQFSLPLDVARDPASVHSASPPAASLRRETAHPYPRKTMM